MRRSVSIGRAAAGLIVALVPMLAFGAAESGEGEGDPGDARVQTAAVVPPTITVQPADVTATVGQRATFRVESRSSSLQRFQWRRNGVPIAGATLNTYTTPRVSLRGSGDRYSVEVASSAGRRVSRGALLSVSRQHSALRGKAWSAGQQVESGDDDVQGFVSGMSDAGRVTAVLAKSDGSRVVLLATRGTPGTATRGPRWTAPVPIDLLDGTPLGLPLSSSRQPLRTHGNVTLAVAPNGNSFATWTHHAACSESTYRPNPAWTCNYIVGARLLAATGTWEPPRVLVDTPSEAMVARINNAGDVALLYHGWVRVNRSFASRAAVVWKAADATDFSGQVFDDADFEPVGTRESPDIGLDTAGRLLVVGPSRQNATRDIAAYRGRVGATRFGAQEVIDRRSDTVFFTGLSMGLGGQALVTWWQGNGVVRESFHAATLARATGNWSVTDLGDFVNSRRRPGFVMTDAGVGLVYSFAGCSFRRWEGGRWSPVSALPSLCSKSSMTFAIARNGNLLAVSDWPGPGGFTTYDAARNVQTQAFGTTSPGPGWVLGLTTQALGRGLRALHLSPRGVGALMLNVPFDELPTPALPLGDGRARVRNLWGLYLE